MAYESAATDEQLTDLLRANLRKNQLEPMSPPKACEEYLEDKKQKSAQSTYNSHRSRLSHFLDYCDEQGIENLNDLTGRDLHRYRRWRREQVGLKNTTEKTEQDTLRVFIRWCEAVNAVPADLSSKVISPSLSEGENSRDTMVPAEDIKRILTHLERYCYASLDHVVWRLLGTTGFRIGTSRALDEADYHPDAEPAYLEVNHRAGETPIKNKERGERLIFQSKHDCTILDDYRRETRPEVTGEFGREPLLATRHGRISGSTIRKYGYKWTRPCKVDRTCPHGRIPEECVAARRAEEACKCPSSKSPHAVRRGHITHQLATGVPRYVISDRCNVSEKVLEHHYDQRTENQKMVQRKELLEKAHEQGDVI
ncbi:tyrosine-type recombinase/integrase [Halomicrococcus sp. NG-SE-24]|uniref:tyrosine-type recombinase/integrase n=1 Tax=Halomicrococcus sp. NG-SE-24 TaxID=3436928 RepID=UPI003D96622B